MPIKYLSHPLFQDPDGLADAPYAPSANGATLPSTVDLRERFGGRDWPVWFQGPHASCTAHAIAGVLQFLKWSEVPHSSWVPSRRFIYYFELLHEARKGETPAVLADRPVKHMRAGCHVPIVHGICTDAVWPYNDAEGDSLVHAVMLEPPPEAVVKTAETDRDYRALRVEPDVDHMRACLAEGYPITLGFALYSGYDNSNTTGDIPMFAKGESHSGGHAVLLIGYDDDAKTFTLRNSEGPDWGASGYGTIPYDYATDPNSSAGQWTIRRAATGR